MEHFRKLGICEDVLKAIEEQKFEKPSEIQEKSIPSVVKGMDIIAGSATGSGKTLVYSTGIIQNCEHGKGIQALVLVPTRELAEQVGKEFKKFAKFKTMLSAVVYGGVAIGPQIDQLRKVDVVIGTPGRILDHLGRRTLDLSRVKILVLDEADKMLDMGFIEDVERIVSSCPKQRQTLLFSATIREEIESLAAKYMNSPVSISAEQYVDPKKLNQVYYNVDRGVKFSALAHLIKHEEARLVMVFCNSRKSVDFIANNLKANGVNAMAIHGGFSQARRSQVMDEFKSQNIEVLVCTDVAARGLDIKDVSHVYNYDIPKDSKEYIHRIGRTARAGKEGKVINLLSYEDYDNFSRVQRDHDINVKLEELPQIEKIFIKWRERPEEGRGGRSGGGFHRDQGHERGGPPRGGNSPRRHSFSR
jgi:ATP-dependent RNA helicase DeaD